MIKAVFIDYTGTLMREENKYAMQMAQLIADNSTIADPRAVVKIWWKLVKEFEETSYQDGYITEEEIVARAVKILENEYELKAKPEAIYELVHKFWAKAPAFEDVKPFFSQCKLPIYVITNNAEDYVNVFLSDNDLHCAGVICGDMVRAYKPHGEIFEKALEISGCTAEEVIHVGDSVISDVNGALAVGISPCLLDRKQAVKSNQYTICSSLDDVLKLL